MFDILILTARGENTQIFPREEPKWLPLRIAFRKEAQSENQRISQCTMK
jgi:hypothetical protein